jgi:hypothetical protein
VRSCLKKERKTWKRAHFIPKDIKSICLSSLPLFSKYRFYF